MNTRSIAPAGGGRASRGLPGLAYPVAWIGVALGSIAGLAHMTGGVVSPFVSLFPLPLILAGFLSHQRAWQAAALASVLYLTLYIGRPLSAGAVASGVLHAALFTGVALLTSALARTRERRQRLLNDAAAEAQHALDIQHMINAAYDLDVTLDLIILKQRDLMAADSYAVMLVEGSTLRVRVASNLPTEGRDVRMGIHEEDHGWCPADARPLLLADARASSSPLREMDPTARSILVAPLHSVERLVGMLFFGSRRPDAFDTEAMDRAEDFANRMVFPIQRALLEEELRRLAFTDAQTSLYNHRHFQAQLEEEVRRAQRYGRPVSVILMDIDFFKRFNDRFGHPTGDRLLRQLSDTLRENLRSVDIPARYGGEEFVVICPETQREQAVMLADRLRALIAATPFEVSGGVKETVTVSMGVAAFPDDAKNKGELVDAADQALYQAKRTGKNRVVVYTPA